MTAPYRRWPALLVLGAVAALGLAACGEGGGGDPAGSGPPPAGKVQDTDGTSAIPEVTVLDVVSGDEFVLGSLVPADRPLLIWFWAPH